MPIIVPHAKLASLLGEQTINSSASTMGQLLDELRARLGEKDWEWASKVTILVNGRNMHHLQGRSTELKQDDLVWMIVPSGGG